VDPPKDPKDYLHRAGRTARAGESGAVVTLVLPKQRRTTQAMMTKAGVAPAEVRVRLGDDKLAEITGAREPSGVPVPPEPESRHERGDRPKRFGDRPQRGAYRGDRDRGFGDRPRGERRYGGGDRSFGGERRGSGFGRPQGERTYGDRAAGDRPTGDRGYTGGGPSGERSYGDRPAGDRGFGGERSTGDRSFDAGRPSGERSYGDRPRSERNFGDRPTRNGERPGNFRRDGQRNDRREGSNGDRRFGPSRPARTY
jgi:superfamily II DNA/RNA helicase